MSNLRDQIIKEQSSLGRHPLGTFDPAEIEDVKEVERSGRIIMEVTVRTEHGTARVSQFMPHYEAEMAAAAHGKQGDAEKQYVQSMARLRRTFTDLGLAEPDGEDHVAMERNAQQRMGEWIGRTCKLVVQENKADARYVRCYINRSAKGAGTSTGGNVSRANDVPHMGGGESAFAGTPDIDSVPF